MKNPIKILHTDLIKLITETVLQYSYDTTGFNVIFEGENIEYDKNDIPDHIKKLIQNQYSIHSHVIDWTKKGRIKNNASTQN